MSARRKASNRRVTRRAAKPVAAKPVAAKAAPVKYLADARRLFPQARVMLRSYPEVIGVSVGLREVGGSPTGEAAFVVTVRRKKKRPTATERLPTELLGVPVDVQESSLPALKRSVAGGMLTQQRGVTPPGHVGFMARDSEGNGYALTAMHVFIRETGNDTYPFRAGPHFPVEIAEGSGFTEIGRLQGGEFTNCADIACIKLGADHSVLSVLLGTSTQLGAPLDPGSVALGSPALLVIPEGPGEVAATLMHYPYDGWFACDGGVLHFNDLLKFRVGADRVEHGWSGSVLFDPFSGCPLTVVSFGTDAPDERGDCFAFGFPLHLHYAAWDLRPV